ncbi:MAG: PEGA domain-containing protein [Polyangiaceae bacterium]|nr:PEGA domain-containing protein [Polyangiaceae bacterium]
MDRSDADGTDRSPADQDKPAGASPNKRLRIVTRCGSLDELVATFGPFADETSLFIVTNKPRPLGLVQPFVIQLKDGATVMRGDVEVVQSTSTGEGPGGRNGMRLKLLTADEATIDVLRRLVEFGRAKDSVAPPPADAVPATPGIARETQAGFASQQAAKSEFPKAVVGDPTASAAPASTARPPTVAVVHSADSSHRAPSEASDGERVPGAAYQLPANPFEGITAEALESFIECTLYEERLPRPDEAPIETSVIVALSSLGPASTAPPATHQAQLPAGVPPPPPMATNLMPHAPPTFAVPAVAPTYVPAPASAPLPNNMLLAAALQAAAAQPQPGRRTLIIGATAVLSSLGSLAAAYFLWGRTPEPSGAPVPTQTASAEVASASVRPPAAPPTASATAAPSATTLPLSTLPRECRANVRSFPDGATVLWNGENLGVTPLEGAGVPCGSAKVTFQLRGYESGERSAGPVAGKTAGVFLRLTPIRVPVDITSKPAGAQILLDGRSMGRTPATINVIGGKESKLVVRLPGYELWTTKLTPEPPKVEIQAELQKNSR